MCLQCPLFPLEIQREIILWLKDEPDVHRYVLVAKRFHAWLFPYLYRRVQLRSDKSAKAFIDRQQPCKVQELVIGKSVTISSAADALAKCADITTLTLGFGYQHISIAAQNPLLVPLDSLHSLRSLFITLVTLRPDRVCFIPNIPIMHRLTHLHLTMGSVTWTPIPLGLSQLANLTHLSMNWAMSCSCTPGLKGFLARDSSRILVLWAPDDIGLREITANLQLRNLVDRRLVVFQQSWFREYIAVGGFWTYAERLVTWRNETNASPFAMRSLLVLPAWYRWLFERRGIRGNATES